MIILDLDGCSCNDEHRLHVLEQNWPRSPRIWDAYHSLCIHDCPANKDVWRDRSDIIVLTGRPADYESATRAWMARHGMKTHFIQMRPVGNVDPAPLLKRIWASRLLKDGVHIDAAYDDRQDIVDMYKSLGINATRLRAHDREWV